MKNKILVRIIVPEIGTYYDIFIPVNELIWRVKVLIVKSISDLNGNIFDIQDDFCLINKDNGRIYQGNEVVINTDIKNASELFLINVKKL
ncbi:MAG: hypothetical protein ACI4XM_03935 [Candidatus Coprovivens sp.]